MTYSRTRDQWLQTSEAQHELTEFFITGNEKENAPETGTDETPGPSAEKKTTQCQYDSDEFSEVDEQDKVV